MTQLGGSVPAIRPFPARDPREPRFADGADRSARAWVRIHRRTSAVKRQDGLVLMSRRDDVIAAAIAPMRREMLALLGRQRTDAIPLSDADLAAPLTGLEFASTVVGRDLSLVLELLQRRT